MACIMLSIHYFSAARAAAGTAREDITETEFTTLGELLESRAQQHSGTTDSGMGLADIFPRCSFLLDGASATPSASLAGVQRVDVLPPFAGG